MNEDAAKPEVIPYEDFAKLDLRVGTVLEVADHPNADKLLVLKVDLGDQQRQIIAGLRGYCSHEQLLGSQIVVVANLAPRKMRGMESCGMLLAATWYQENPEDQSRVMKVVPIVASMPTPPGSTVS